MTSGSIHPYNPWCIAHRGAQDEAPENTLAAFERALAYPIDGIELDVQMSADGVPVLYHDRTLYRVLGRRKRLAQLTHDQLMNIDWGGWFGSAFFGTPLATLSQTLMDFGSRTRLLIEIKSRAADQSTGHVYRLTDLVLEMLTTHRPSLSSERIHILSFDPQVLMRAHQQEARWRYVLNLSSKDPTGILASEHGLMPTLWAVCIKIGWLTHPLMQWAGEHGLKVLTYACNGPRQVKKALDLQVDAILSDRPGWLTRHLGRLGQ